MDRRLLCGFVIAFVLLSKSAPGDDWAPGNLLAEKQRPEQLPKPDVPDWKRERQEYARYKAAQRRAILEYRRATGWYDARRTANYGLIYEQQARARGYGMNRSYGSEASCSPRRQSMYYGMR